MHITHIIYLFALVYIMNNYVFYRITKKNDKSDK